MKPEATAVMMIEGGDTCYLGHLIPTTMGLENKLHNCMDNVTKPLVDGTCRFDAARFGAGRFGAGFICDMSGNV